MLGNEKYEEITELANFRELLKLWDDIIFGDSIYETSKRCEIWLRRPENFKNQYDMMLIHSYMPPMKAITSDLLSFCTKKECSELRDAVLASLIILN